MDYMTVNEVAALLRHDRSTIYELIAAGAFPGAFRSGIGGKTSPWRIPRGAVEKYQGL